MRPIRIYNPGTCNQPGFTMIVCVCHRISDREIARFARAGMGFDEIQLELGVATQCGNCEGCARELVSQCHASAPLAAVHNDAHAQRACACAG